MNFDELKKKSQADLAKELANVEFELMRLKSMVATGSAGKESGKIRNHKRTIARIKTIIRQQKEVPANK